LCQTSARTKYPVIILKIINSRQEAQVTNKNTTLQHDTRFVHDIKDESKRYETEGLVVNRNRKKPSGTFEKHKRFKGGGGVV
jgi:hypothetical protein